MNVLLISDDNYAFLLAACLHSMMVSNEDANKINIFVISDNISKKTIDSIKSIVDTYGGRIVFLDPPHMNEDIVVKGNLNISTYYRLMIPSVLPSELEKVLYLDCDILVRGSLKPLWETDIEECYVAGVTDTTGVFARSSIGLKANDKYVNAGMMLVNLKKWREDSIEELFFEFLKAKNWKVEFNDQGVINKVCSKGIKLVSPKYNFMPTYERYSHRQLKKYIGSETFYDPSEVIEAKKNPIIIHFAGYAFSRPWYYGSKGRYNEEFRRFLDEGEITFEYRKQPKELRYRIRRCINHFPNVICIVLNISIDKIYARTLIKEEE